MNLLQSFLLILYLFVKTKYYLQAHLDYCACKMVVKRMKDCLGDNHLVTVL